jgi:anaerobic selenocysteine-containing dehydrogenase
LNNYSSFGKIDNGQLECEGEVWNLKDISLRDRFKKVDYQFIPEDKEYPMTLITGNTHHHFGSLTQKCESINLIE